MNVIQSTVLIVCVVSIIFCIVSNMIDTSKFEKELRLIFFSILITTVLKSVANIDTSNLQWDYLGESLQYTDQSEVYKQVATTQVETSIQQLLQDNGLHCENISLDINITEDSSISINKVLLNVDDFQKACYLLRQNFGDSIIISEW